MNRHSALTLGLALVLTFAACGGTDDATETSSTTTTTIEPATTTSTSTTSSTTTPPTTTTSTTTTSTTTTTTEPPDVTPPELLITAPQPGATVTTRTYRFEGTTEPGCTVAAGRWVADVDPTGNWSIVLVLNEGSNLATFVATDETGNTTTAKIAINYNPPPRNSDFYSLTGNNPERFPDSPFSIAFVGMDDAAAQLVAEFGEPDEGWVPDEGRWSIGDQSWIAWIALEGEILAARVKPLGNVRLALYSEIVLGSSTVADLITNWGEPLHVTADGSCPPWTEPLVDCYWMVYTSHGEKVSFFWNSVSEPAGDWILEGVAMGSYWWGMFFIDNGAVGLLGNVSEECDERGCRVHSDSTYWVKRNSVTPFYSWGADCLDDACEYVAIFIGTAPPDDVPIADRWKVQTSDAIGGFLLARPHGESFEVIGTSYASQSSDHPLVGPIEIASDPEVFWYTETIDGSRYEAWEIDLGAQTITRLACDGPTRADCRPVWE